jgi:uncharacterized membrane protein
MSSVTTIARALGALSLVLGLAQLLAPRRFARAIGLKPDGDRVTATRLVGVRELGAAGGLLARPKAAGWSWVRVVGDVMDLGMLARALSARDARRARVGMALAAVAGIAAVDVASGIAMTARNGKHPEGDAGPGGPKRIRRAVTVRVPRQHAYEAWRDLERLPRFMRHLEEVRVLDERRSHWKAKAPAGRTVEWDAEIIDDRPGEALAWRSTGASQVSNAGTVRFIDAPGDRGTEIHVEFEYAPPFGALGSLVAGLFGEEPEQQAADDLRRFKQMVETGRVVWSDATVEDRKLRQRPAQPPEDAPVQPSAVEAGAKPALREATPA